MRLFQRGKMWFWSKYLISVDPERISEYTLSYYSFYVYQGRLNKYLRVKFWSLSFLRNIYYMYVFAFSQAVIKQMFNIGSNENNLMLFQGRVDRCRLAISRICIQGFGSSWSCPVSNFDLEN